MAKLDNVTDILVKVAYTSKIEKFNLAQDCVDLRRAGLSFTAIADELNATGRVPEGEKISKFAVSKFFSQLPNITRAIVKEKREYLIDSVNAGFDICHELKDVYNKTKIFLELMEEESVEKGRMMDAYRYKAVVSELREFLSQMSEIQKEMNDYDNIRAFMEVVIKTLQEECPEQLPIIAHKLKLAKGTSWFASMVGAK